MKGVIPRKSTIDGKTGRGGVRGIVACEGRAWTCDRGNITHVFASWEEVQQKRLARFADRLDLDRLGNDLRHTVGQNTHRVPTYLYALSANAFRIGLPGGVHWMLDDVLRDVSRFRTQRRRVEIARAVFQLFEVASTAEMSLTDRANAQWLGPIRASVSGWLYDDREEIRRWRT